MDQRSWNTPQLNEVPQSASDGGELNAERLELSGRIASFGGALVQERDSLPAFQAKVSIDASKPKTCDTEVPEKSPDFSIESPSMLTLSRKVTAQDEQSLTSERKREAAMMEYEDDSTAIGYVSPPARKRMRRFPRRNSVVIRRREGGTASMLQEVLDMTRCPSRYPQHHHTPAPPAGYQNQEWPETMVPLGLPVNRSDGYRSQHCRSQKPPPPPPSDRSQTEEQHEELHEG